MDWDYESTKQSFKLDEHSERVQDILTYMLRLLYGALIWTHI